MCKVKLLTPFWLLQRKKSGAGWENWWWISNLLGAGVLRFPVQARGKSREVCAGSPDLLGVAWSNLSCSAGCVGVGET